MVVLFLIQRHLCKEYDILFLTKDRLKIKKLDALNNSALPHMNISKIHITIILV